MAYIPTLEDTPTLGQSPNNGYIPTLEDTPNITNNDKFSGMQPIPFNPGFFEKLSPNILAGLGTLGQNLLNKARQVSNGTDLGDLLGPQTNYNFSSMLKLPGTTADKVVQNVAEYSPAAFLGSAPTSFLNPVLGRFGAAAIGRAIPQAAFGAAVNPDSVQGAEQGAVSSGLSEILPAAAGLLKKALSPFQADAYAKNIVNALGGKEALSDTPIENNAKALAGSIKNNYENVKSISDQNYNDIFNTNNIGNKNIYKTVGDYGGIGGAILKPDIDIEATGDLKLALDNFNKSPTLQNANELQSQLGHSAYQIKPIGSQDIQAKGQYLSYQKQIQDDINSFITNENPDLVGKYQAARDYYRDNVAPYKNDKDLNDIATGKIKNPTNTSITSIFKSPEPNVAGKVADDLSEQDRNRILYSALNRNKSNLNANAIASSPETLDRMGLGSYISPNYMSQINLLSKKIGAKELAQKVGGGGLGAYLGAHFGASPAIEALLSGYGGAFGPQLAHQLSGSSTNPYMDALSRGLANAYYPVARSLIGNQEYSPGIDILKQANNM